MNQVDRSNKLLIIVTTYLKATFESFANNIAETTITVISSFDLKQTTDFDISQLSYYTCNLWVTAEPSIEAIKCAMIKDGEVSILVFNEYNIF